jgi:hypothetical protein
MDSCCSKLIIGDAVEEVKCSSKIGINWNSRALCDLSDLLVKLRFADERLGCTDQLNQQQLFAP